MDIQTKAVRRVRTIRGALRYRRGLGDGIIPSYLLKLRGTPMSELYVDIDGRYARKPKAKAKVKKTRNHTTTNKHQMKSLDLLTEIKGIRHVRTPAGAARFKQPIGTVIFEKPSLDLFKKMTPDERLKSVQDDLKNIATAYQNGDITEKRAGELRNEVFGNIGISAPKGNITQRDIDRVKKAIASFDAPEKKPRTKRESSSAKPDADKPQTPMTDAEKLAARKVREARAERAANNRFGKVERIKGSSNITEQEEAKKKRREEYDRLMARSPEQIAKDRAEARAKYNADRRAKRAEGKPDIIETTAPTSIEEMDLVQVAPKKIDGGYSFSTPDGERIIRDGKITLSDGTDVTGDYAPNGAGDMALAQAIKNKYTGGRGRPKLSHRNPTSVDQPNGMELYSGYGADRDMYENVLGKAKSTFNPPKNKVEAARENMAAVDAAFARSPQEGLTLLGEIIAGPKYLPSGAFEKYKPLIPKAANSFVRARRAEADSYKAGSSQRSRDARKPKITASNSKFAEIPVTAMTHAEIREYLDEAKGTPSLQKARTAEVRANLDTLGISASSNKSLMEKVKNLAKKHNVTDSVARGRKVGSKDTVERAFTARYRSVQRIQKFSSTASERKVLKELLGHDPVRGEFYADIKKPNGERDVLIRRKDSDGNYQGFDRHGNAVTLADSDPAVVLSGMADIAGLRVAQHTKTETMRRATPEEISALREQYGSSLPDNASIVWTNKNDFKHEEVAEAIAEGNKPPSERRETRVSVNDTLFSYMDLNGDIKHVKPREIGGTIDWDKWDRYSKVNEVMPKINRAINRDMRENEGSVGREMQIATVAKLMQEHGIRIGSSERKVGNVESFGASQLRKEYVKEIDGVVHLQFTGKSGKVADYTIGSNRTNPLAKALINFRDNQAGETLFPNANADNVKSYLRKISGIEGIKNHDMRTAYANNIMATMLARAMSAEPTMTAARYKKVYNEAASKVADALNDTVATAKNDYISPFLKDFFDPMKG